MSSNLVTFRGGFVAHMAVVARLIEIEARGARLELLDDGRFRVVPVDVLTQDDRAFLLARAAEARAVVRYCDELAPC